MDNSFLVAALLRAALVHGQGKGFPCCAYMASFVKIIKPSIAAERLEVDKYLIFICLCEISMINEQISCMLLRFTLG